MVSILASDLSTRDRHHLMTSTILPRPIAWISTLGPDDQVNLAPFSYYNGVSAKPPLLSVSLGTRRSGMPKDTLVNIRARKEFVVHVVDEAHAHHMVETSGDFPPEESELDIVGLRAVPSDEVAVPRLADAPVAMECVLHDEYTPPEASATMVIGRIVKWHVRDGLLTGDGDEGDFTADVHRLRPLGRLGYDHYCPVREVFEMKAPR